MQRKDAGTERIELEVNRSACCMPVKGKQHYMHLRSELATAFYRIAIVDSRLI